MGEEITRSTFTPEDFVRFDARLRAETEHLETLFANGGMSDAGYSWGFELEAWLLDHGYFPTATNVALLERLDDADVVPELSRFNVELNTPPREFTPDTLSGAETALQALWDRCNAVAHTLDTNMVMIGTLPTIREADLSLDNISPLKRYYALNNEILRSNGGRPLRIDIAGREHLTTRHVDVMLEAAATSFQIHLKTPVTLAHHYYNASLALSAPLLAVSANAPLLFDRLLWEETRIPLFEQSIAGVGGAAARHPRVNFGGVYAEHSLFELFAENLLRYPALLPICFDQPAAELRHLRLHNGTIWRWNRPLVGDGPDGLHVRLEHRPLPAGPTVVDMIANAALYLGATHEWVMRERSTAISAAAAQANFYAAARDGLEAMVTLADGARSVRDWLLEELLADADSGLARFGIAATDRARYLGIIEARAASGCTGARWQRECYLAHARHPFKLMAAYCEHQRSGLPVHQWPSPGRT